MWIAAAVGFECERESIEVGAHAAALGRAQHGSLRISCHWLGRIAAMGTPMACSCDARDGHNANRENPNRRYPNSSIRCLRHDDPPVIALITLVSEDRLGLRAS